MSKSIAQTTGYRLTQADQPPAKCPPWCDPGSHPVDRLEVYETPEDLELAREDLRTHFGCVAHEHLFEHRMHGRVTRPEQGSWDVLLEEDPGTVGAGDWRESVVRLMVGPAEGGPSVTLDLTAAEALVLAEALKAGAHALTFDRPARTRS